LKFDAQHVQLSVRDDGHGFDRQKLNGEGKHFGLVGMEERAVQIGASLRISSRTGEGTEVLVEVPIGAPDIVEDI
jgi:signal transduction histidine kinase